MKKRSVLKSSPDWTDADYVEYWKSKCIVTETGCWDWQGFCAHFNHQQPGQRGYAEAGYRGKKVRLSRFMLSLKIGRPLTAEEEACHSCDHKPCFNPDHLFVGNRKTNCEDAQRKGRYWYQRATHCKHGHEFTPENTRIEGRGFRQCRTCEQIRFSSEAYKAYGREYQRRKREAKRAARSALNGSGDERA